MKVIFIHAPKTAGIAVNTSLKEVGVLHSGHNHRTLREVLAAQGYSRQNNETWEKFRNRLTAIYSIMTVCRNPYDRLYSIFEFYTRERAVLAPMEFYKLWKST